jgi:hypothetical protein
MAITPLPSAPLPTDGASEFNRKAFALIGALDAFVSETNDVADLVDTASTAASASQSAAATSATNANASATASAASATLATTKATSATASAASAQTNATQAAQSAANAHSSEVAAALSVLEAASAVSATHMPSSLIGQALKVLKVNAGETGYALFESAALPRLYGFALSADSSELMFTDAKTGGFAATDFVSWFIGENLTFSINNNELVIAL